MSHHYADHSHELKSALGREIPTEALRELHARRPVVHAGIAVALFSVLGLSSVLIANLDRWFLWLPFAVISGFAVFNFTVMLHEVVHRTVLATHDDRKNRFIGFLYSVPSGISASQFTRWHLDHHAGLGSFEEDPKRHYLSPKINARWFKALYFTPALFPIYFRAARLEAASYPIELQKTIKRERLATILFHLGILGVLIAFAGFPLAWKIYMVPVFFVFPVAFALNRLGQHFDIDPADPAKWATLVKGSRLWDVVFLFSNYHLEHHYFPMVPFYNLPALQRLLAPFYERRGFSYRTYGQLLWQYLVLNRKPHTRWESAPSADGLAVRQS